MLKISVYNVGHGQAIHILTPANKLIVIDLGASDEVSPIELIRRTWDRIDCLIITHPHADHIYEVGKIRRVALPVDSLVRPAWLPRDVIIKANENADSTITDEYFYLSDSSIFPVPSSLSVLEPQNNGGVSFSLFESRSCPTSNINNHSYVTIVEYLGIKTIIPGDNEEASWTELLQSPAFCEAISNAHIFIPSHHGRQSGYCSELFDHFIPKVCIVSDGPEGDTSISSAYSNLAQGWLVHSRSGSKPETRKCITTRNDGRIEIDIGLTPDQTKFLQVEKD